jgi:hypothetical protein
MTGVRLASGRMRWAASRMDSGVTVGTGKYQDTKNGRTKEKGSRSAPLFLP